MYDAESRGNRVLERCLLSPDFQRLVLIGAGKTCSTRRYMRACVFSFQILDPVLAVTGTTMAKVTTRVLHQIVQRGPQLALPCPL